MIGSSGWGSPAIFQAMSGLKNFSDTQFFGAWIFLQIEFTIGKKL
jgi:hypothetical protein